MNKQKIVVAQYLKNWLSNFEKYNKKKHDFFRLYFITLLINININQAAFLLLGNSTYKFSLLDANYLIKPIACNFS